MSKNCLPIVTGISPHQGVPGTQITIRGENLGTDSNDLLALVICGTDCLVSAKWKSSSKIIARLGQAKRGVGDIVIVTRSGGKGISNVQFRVFIEEVGALQESSVWVDEHRTVPGRNFVRNISETLEHEDALGLKNEENKKIDQSVLAKLFPEFSGNTRLENFCPAWYLLERHKFTRMEDLRTGLKNLQNTIAMEDEMSKNVRKANLTSLINCANSLTKLHSTIEKEIANKNWPITKALSKKNDESKKTADKLFCDILNRKDRADTTRNALSVLTRFRFIFFLPESIDDNLAKEDFTAILNDYARAKSLFQDSDVGLFKEVLMVLDQKILFLKQTIHQKLIDVLNSFEVQSKFIKYLKILDPDSDPAWDCIKAYHCWLEELLWQTQKKYFKHAFNNDDKNNKKLHLNNQENLKNYYQNFITELLSVLTEKLDFFWKLSQNYSNDNEKEFQEKLKDIEQMLKNTVNVASWLLLNIIVPASLPESVTDQYKYQFVTWPKLLDNDQSNYLFFSLQSLRTAIKLLLNPQLTLIHLQPLLELCMTIRIKCLGLVIEKASEAITNLADCENWTIDVVSEVTKTSLPDLYVTEISKIFPNVKEILSTNNFTGEVDLFDRERICQMIIDLFLMLILHYKDCTDQLLQLKTSTGSKQLNEINTVNYKETENKGKQEITSRKLLIAICNIEFVRDKCVPKICDRLSEYGVKYCEYIITKANQKFSQYQNFLLKHYVATKMSTIISLLEINYTQLPDEENISDFVKELIMFVVFVQAELLLISPHLINKILSPIIDKILDGIIKLISKINLNLTENVTQAAIDLTALEETFKTLINKKKLLVLHSTLLNLMKKINNESFDKSMHNFKKGLGMAIKSLKLIKIDESNDLFEDSEATNI